MMLRVPASLLSLALAASLLAAAARAQEPPPSQDQDPATFRSCLVSLKPEALKRGVSASTYDTQIAQLSPDMTVLPLLDAQPEFKQPVWDYMAGLVDQERVDDGQAAMTRWRAQLDRVQAQFGVDAAVVTAVWGIASNYGRIQAGRLSLTEPGRKLGTASRTPIRQVIVIDHTFQGGKFSIRFSRSPVWSPRCGPRSASP